MISYGFEVAPPLLHCIVPVLQFTNKSRAFPAKIQTVFVRTIFKMWGELKRIFKNGISNFLATTTDKSRERHVPPNLI